MNLKLWKVSTTQLQTDSGLMLYSQRTPQGIESLHFSFLVIIMSTCGLSESDVTHKIGLLVIPTKRSQLSHIVLAIWTLPCWSHTMSENRDLSKPLWFNHSHQSGVSLLEVHAPTTQNPSINCFAHEWVQKSLWGDSFVVYWHYFCSNT